MSDLGILLQDSETGAIRAHMKPDWLTEWDWVDGNWSCDCNRAAAFGDFEHGGMCRGSRRYRVIDAKGIPEERRAEFLRDANRHYPAVKAKP